MMKFINILFVFLFLVTVSSCGLKTAPVPPPDEDNYSSGKTVWQGENANDKR